MDDDRNTTGLYGDHRKAPYNISRENRPQLFSKMTFRESYTQNSVKEELQSTVCAAVPNPCPSSTSSVQ